MIDLDKLEDSLRTLVSKCECCIYAVGGFVAALLTTWIV